ncbi:arsenate reductase (glutaredoxin) [Marinomonas epiphytica]
MTVIYHNPRCSKSRQTLQLLSDNGIEAQIRLYLKEPPSRNEIEALLTQLSISPIELMRTKEALYKELGLTTESTDEERVTAMLENPSLIERPIVIHNNKAAIGRPPENVLVLFK